ncbi:SRPBCC domain-containing protein [Leifsonia sp. YIM 134122]|uniref:SRPBCC domain-containing protein n=1 Tax=Leifsonia stereocauli TaxID=3134136 RepID=A0ABU9VZG5_9MICO
MSRQDYTATISVSQTPDAAFAAITDPRAWWSEMITGDTAKVGDVFVFDFPGVHRSTMTLTEVIPGQRVVWHVTDTVITLVENQDEWNDTDVIFDIQKTDAGTDVRFTHVGLTPAFECYELCSNAWGSYITSSLRDLIESGGGTPIETGDSLEAELLRTDARKAASVDS